MKKSFLLSLALLLPIPALAQTPPVAPVTSPVIRVACVGDSITHGSGTTNAVTQSYPAQLSRLLGPGYLVANFGVGGATLMDEGDKPYRRQRAFKEALSFKPDVVVILLGTNDSKPQNWSHKDRFVADFESLIEQFNTLASKPKVFVGYPIVVMGQGNYGINEAGVEEAMPMIDRIAADEKATVVNLHATLMGKDALIPDRVHPNNEGAGMLAKDVYKAVTGQAFIGPVPPLAPPAAASSATPQTPPATTP